MLGGAKYKYMKLSELQSFLMGCVDLGFTFPLNPKWVLCDKGWKELWDKLTGSAHPNVELSINAWYPPGSGLRERVEEIHQKFPSGFDSDFSGRKKGTQAWDEAELALERYQRIQRAKRKMVCVLGFISILQQIRKKVQDRAIEAGKVAEEKFFECNEKADDATFNEFLDLLKSADGPTQEEKPASPTVSPSTTESTLNDEGAKPPAAAAAAQDTVTAPIEEETQEGAMGNVSKEQKPLPGISEDSPEKRVSFQDSSASFTKMGNLNSKGHVRSHTDPAHLAVSEGGVYRRSSSTSSSDGDENDDLIDSLLNSDLPLSEYQTVGLQRLRDKLSKSPSSQPSDMVNNRVGRRHTSNDTRISPMMLEDVPSFILKEYGGAKGEGRSAKTIFCSSVKTIINAQRLVRSLKDVNELFLPVEWTSMSTETKQKLYEKLSFKSLSSWECNMPELAKLCEGNPLLFVGWAIIGSPHSQQAMAKDLGLETDKITEGYNFIPEFSVQVPILCSFLRTVEADYLDNPYHNNIHASDVVQTLNTMLQLGGKNYASSPLDIFSILVAAVIHDVKHPGLNNNFQVNSHSELAVQYNDVSVLENNSVTWLFSKLLGQTRDFTVDIFSGLSNEQFSKARSMIIRSVLETDMTHHFALLKKMGIHRENLKGKPTEEWLESYTNEGVNYDPSMDMLCFLLHQADISNPAKPYPLFVDWADKILSECYAQGDKEASLSLPVSPLCDRVTTDKKQSQIGFIKFVVQPSYKLLGEIIPLFAKTVFPHIERSLEFWEDYDEDA